MKNIGLLGLGYWGKNILRTLYELNAVSIACDTNAQIVEKRKAEFPAIKYTIQFEDVIKGREAKAIIISTPARTHYELTKKSLEAGKDVFVEKPLALNLKEAEELVKLAGEKQRILMVGHILQYHAAIIKLKELIDKKALGKIQYIYSNRLNIGRLRTEENILWSFAPHDISIILMLIKEEPTKVFAFGGDYLKKGIYDTTLTTLEFESGIKGHVFVSWLHPYKEQKLIVVGSKVMAVFDDLIEEKLLLYPHRIDWIKGKIPIAHKADRRIIAIEKKEPLKEELRHFINCIHNRKNPRTDGRESLKVLKVIESAEKSLKANY